MNFERTRVVFGLMFAVGSLGGMRTAAAQVPATPQTDPNAGTNPTGQAPPPADLPPAPREPPPAPAGDRPRETQVPYAPPPPNGVQTVPPPSPATPAPSTLEKVAGAVSSLVRFYGTFKPTIDVSVGAQESFSNINAVAPSAAGNPALANLPKDTRYSFQAQQTRFGFWVAEKSQARAHLEVDFVDFTKASPTVAAVPRLRIAEVEYEPIEHFVITAGQGWDLYAPVNPFTTNLVGNAFEAGNSGFMRQQVKFIYTVPETAELGFAVGMPAQNSGALDASIELARVPTFAVRAAALVGKTGKIGVSGIATQLKLGLNTPEVRRTGSYSANLFADIGQADGFQLKSEAYIARNLNNIGALTLGFGTATHDIDEMGGFISGRQQLAEKHAVYLTVGAAGVLNPSEMISDYTYTAATATTAASRTLANGTRGPGIKFNMTAKLGYEYRPYKPIAIIVEPVFFRTRHVLANQDWGKFDPMRNAAGFETSMMYFF